MSEFGRILIILGVILVLAGAIIMFAARSVPWLGNLPGDLRIENDNFSFFLPLTTMILISVIGTLILNIVLRIFRR